MNIPGSDGCRTILCFDSWTAGSHNFSRLVPAFEQQGFKLLLIHVGSWGHDQHRAKEEVINSLHTRDISYYGSRGFDEILDLENPLAVIFLSTRAFVHLAVNRYARHRNIPTVHLYHGLMASLSFELDERPVKTNWTNQINIIAQRIYKNIRYILPTYAVALFKTRAPINSWYEFIREASIKVTGDHYGKAPGDAVTDAGCVYTELDVEHMATVYSVSRQHIHIVGNPDLMRLRVREKDLGSLWPKSTKEERLVLYVACGFSGNGLIYKDANDFLEHLLEVADALRVQGYSLKVKLHPAEIKTGMREKLEEKGLNECKDEDFFTTMKSASAVICEPSSVAIVPALMGLPLGLAQFGRLEDLRFGKVLATYPKSFELKDLQFFSQSLGMLEVDRSSFDSWVQSAAGPLPSEAMPERVAQAVLSLVH